MSKRQLESSEEDMCLFPLQEEEDVELKVSLPEPEDYPLTRPLEDYPLTQPLEDFPLAELEDVSLTEGDDVSLGPLEANLGELKLSETASEVPVTELAFVQVRLRGLMRDLHRLKLTLASQARPDADEWHTKGLPHLTWEETQRLLYVDEKQPCSRGQECVGVKGQLASLYLQPGSVDPWPGAPLRAWELGTPCVLCLIHQTHAIMFLFMVNRLPLRVSEPFQPFYHSDEYFHRGMLLRPDKSVFNGLVAPIMMFVQDKLVWDFDQAAQQWFVNIAAFKRPDVEPGVRVEATLRASHLKEPKK